MEFDDYIILFSASISAFFIIRLLDTFGKGDSFNTFIACIYSFIITVLLIFYFKKPKPIDVYRNKTTLEITYKDGVPIDSTVVWKYR